MEKVSKAALRAELRRVRCELRDAANLLEFIIENPTGPEQLQRFADYFRTIVNESIDSVPTT